ncbi:hypothetical protein [Rhizobium leguminosarum]|uniref:hypothetical protein n=1 Tax=Rhizobium leguminosarum TaxID=384 RepID=UPI0014424C1B|nr:hypothetical protein [Rhizobium leguminosarum]NKK77702.1 hypothetical protein [Rhizobium leguminosarum bv. viciae]
MGAAFLLLGMATDGLFYALYKLTPLLIGYPLIAGESSSWYGLLMIFVLGRVIVMLDEGFRTLATAGRVRKVVDSLGERLGLTILSLDLNLSDKKPGWIPNLERMRLRMVLGKMKGRIYVIHQSSFNSGRYLSGLNTLASPTEGFLFLSNHPKAFLPSEVKLFQLFHEIGHCHLLNVRIFGRYQFERLYLLLPTALYAWHLDHGATVTSVWVGALSILVMILSTALLKVTDRLQAEMHADNFSLRVLYGLSGFDNSRLMLLRNTPLPVDVDMIPKFNSQREAIFDLNFEWLAKLGALRDGTLQTVVPFKFRAPYVIALLALCQTCIWQADLSSFPWDAIWILAAATIGFLIFVSISTLKLHIRLFELVDDVGKLVAGVEEAVIWTPSEEWYKPRWDVGLLSRLYFRDHPRKAQSRQPAS